MSHFFPSFHFYFYFFLPTFRFSLPKKIVTTGKKNTGKYKNQRFVSVIGHKKSNYLKRISNRLKQRATSV